MSDPIAYPIDDAAAAVGLSSREIRRAIAAGDLVAHYGGLKGTKPLIARTELEAWFLSLTTVHPSERRTA